MKRTSKAATAGSTKRLGKKSKPALPLCVLAAAVAALALVVGSASGATTRFLVETFGSSAQPTFPGDRGMAVDQATGELYVLETNTDEIRRYNSDGTVSNFSALGSNVIDGEGAEDETPDLGLAIANSRSESQIAIDESGGATDGNIYVTESSRDQVSIFSSAGEYLGELSEHSGGALNEPLGVAVDPSGNVYVGDFSAADLVHKYEPAANPPVNADNTASFNSLAGTSSPGTLAAGAGATAGFIFVNRFNGELFKLDATTGELKYQLTTSASTVSVDPTTGHVFVPRLTGSNSEVVEYDASGVAEAAKVSAFKPGSTAEGVAVNSAAEQVYVARSSTENVEVFGPAAIVPDVVTQAPTANTGTRATLAGTVNPDGVELDECFFEWGPGSGSTPYTETTPCAETPAEIGAGTSPVAVHADLNGLKPQGTNYHYRLVATNPNATINGSNQNFTTPNTVIAEAASGVTFSEATLNGTVNPDTETLSGCVFEWGPQKGQFDEAAQTFPETAPCVPGPGGIGSGEAPVAVEADIGGLDVGTTYVYRLKVTYPAGAAVNPSSAGGETLLTLGPAINGVWSEDVVRTEATLKAAVNPEGKETTYYFEYGTTEAYGSETPEGSAGSAKEVTAFLDGLEPDTTYHYRFVATNADATNESEDHAFTTHAPVANNTDCPNRVFRTGPSASLPDCRAFEMVSPVQKGGQDVYADRERFGYIFGQNNASSSSQSSLDGDKVTYASSRSFGDQPSSPVFSQWLASRDADGWSPEGINPSIDGGMLLTSNGTEYRAFSPDLSLSWLSPIINNPLALGAVEGQVNTYLRDNTTGAYTTLSIAEEANQTWFPEFAGASDDGSYGAFGVREKLTPEATSAVPNGDRQFYVWHDGEIHAVGILPNGETYPGANQLGALGGAFQGAGGADNNLSNAISDDGSRVFWTAIEEDDAGQIYMREHAEQGVVAGECVEAGKACTIPVSGSVSPDRAKYWTASTDGSRVLFSFVNESNGLTDGALYLFDVETETPTLIAATALGVAGASDDLARFYFTSEEALAPGAEASRPNFYLYDEGVIELIGPLSQKDASPQLSLEVPRVATVFLAQNVSKVTPDGRHIVFAAMSSELAAQVGYDNLDINSGQPAYEVYIYDVGGELRCVSCNPSGARPDAKAEEGGKKTAAWIHPWFRQYYPRRYVSDDGNRVFFNSFEGLALGDSNGFQDVYQWEAPGSGDCTEASPSFSALNGGCISLLSGGVSAEESTFLDASTSGDDVFIRTEGSLVAKDPAAWDVYDARAGGGLSQPVTSAECEGDACQGVPEPPRFPSHASSAFRGAGDPQTRRNCGAQVRRAAKFSRRAKRMRRAAKRSSAANRKARLRRRSNSFAKRAKRLSTGAKRCRRANRRAGR